MTVGSAPALAKASHTAVPRTPDAPWEKKNTEAIGGSLGVGWHQLTCHNDLHRPERQAPLDDNSLNEPRNCPGVRSGVERTKALTGLAIQISKGEIPVVNKYMFSLPSWQASGKTQSAHVRVFDFPTCLSSGVSVFTPTIY